VAGKIPVTHDVLAPRDEDAVDPLDVRLEDSELLEEVELTTSLIVAANQSETRLSLSEIDAILGVDLQRRDRD